MAVSRVISSRESIDSSRSNGSDDFPTQPLSKGKPFPKEVVAKAMSVPEPDAEVRAFSVLLSGRPLFSETLDSGLPGPVRSPSN